MGSLEDDFPLSDEPTANRFTILAGGKPVGMVQVTEENEPDYRTGEYEDELLMELVVTPRAPLARGADGPARTGSLRA